MIKTWLCHHSRHSHIHCIIACFVFKSLICQYQLNFPLNRATSPTSSSSSYCFFFFFFFFFFLYLFFCRNEPTLLGDIHEIYILCKFATSFFPSFLGVFAKLQKVTMRYILSVRPSVRLSVGPLGTNRLPLDGFSWKPIFGYFSKTCQENSSFIKN